MKQHAHLLSALLLAVLLLVGLVTVTACDSGKTSTAETTQGATDGATTEAVTASPTVALTAADVDALIAEIDGATLENEAKMDAAYLAYCSLSEEERAKVTGFETLQSYRYELTKAYVVKEYMDTRMRHNELLLGAYVCNQTTANINTDAHVSDMKDCYIDFAWQLGGYSALDLYQKYDIGVFEWSAYLGLYTYFDATPDNMRDVAAGKQYDHEALWGIFQADEPRNYEIAGYWNTGKVLMDEILPECAYNVTIYANLGDTSYYEENLVRHYAATVDNDFLCYDHYVYDNQINNPLANMLNNLDIAARCCRDYDRDLYLILQGFNEGDTMPVERLKFQAYSAMAYGAKSITWACWIRGWGENNVLDEEGNKTPLYDNLKEVNRELVALEPVYMRYTGVSDAVLIGEKHIARKNLATYEGNLDASHLKQESLTELAVDKKHAMLVGHFEKNVGEGEAFLFVGLNNFRFPNDNQLATATFKTVDPDATVIAYVGGMATKLTPDENGVYTVDVVNADAVFVTVDRGSSSKEAKPIPEEETGLLYLLNEKGTAYTVVGMAESNNALDVVIPASVRGLPVTAIGQSAFGSRTITSVTIPESVTKIGDHAFVCCAELTSVTILGEGLTEIGPWAFAACLKLPSVTLPSSVTVIGYGTFSTCKSLTDVDLGSSLTEIGGYAFNDCYAMRGITLPDSLITIDFGAFRNAISMTSITIPSSVTSMEENIFVGCAALTDIYCAAAERPEGWPESWIVREDTGEHSIEVHWGYTGE